MIFSREIFRIVRKCRDNKSCSGEEFDKIKQLVTDAGKEFKLSRDLAPYENEYGYISHIILLFFTLDFIRQRKLGFKYTKRTSRNYFIVSEEDEWYRELFDIVGSLVKELELIRQGEEPSNQLVECQNELIEQYGDLDVALTRWNDLLNRNNVYQPLVRRQVARISLDRVGGAWEKLSATEIGRIVDLLERNVDQEPDNDRNIREWFNAARHSDRYTLEEAIEKLSYWRANKGTIDASFYLYVLQTLQTINGIVSSTDRVQELLVECNQKANKLLIRNRTQPLEWLSKGNGLRQITNYRELGDLEKEFDSDGKLLLIEGYIRRIDTPVSGEIELLCGLRAFFHPTHRLNKNKYLKGRDEETHVQFYLAFSYDQIIARALRDVEDTNKK